MPKFETEDDEIFCRRVRFFAKGAVMTAGVLVFLAIMGLLGQVYIGAGPAGGIPPLLQGVYQVQAQLYGAVTLVGVAVLATAAARVSARPRAGWVPVLEEPFVRRAYALALTIMATAGVFLILQMVTSAGWVAVSGPVSTFLLVSTLSMLAQHVKRFVLLMLTGLTILALLRLSVKAALSARQEPEESDV